MSFRASLYSFTLAILTASSAACVATVGSAPSEPPDATPGSGDPGTGANSDTLYKVAITSLPGASPNAGIVGVYKPTQANFGTGTAPALSNSWLSAIPGAPPKPQG